MVDLAGAVRGLYAVFGAVPRPARIDYCDHCFLAEEERALLAPVPLAELTVDALAPYAANVPFTVGGRDDLRYFVPRLLEIATIEGFRWPDLESLIGRLRHAGWTTWRPEEQAAIRDYLHALWTDTLGGDGRDAADVLCAIGNAEDDLSPYLEEWAAVPEAGDHLLDLLRDGRRRTKGQWRLANPFWDERPDQAAQVLAWLSGADLLDAAAGDELIAELSR